MAPANIELLIKREPLVSQVVVLGDAKPYLVALITLSAETIEAEGLAEATIDRRVAQAVESANKHLARYEQIKRYRRARLRIQHRDRRNDPNHEDQCATWWSKTISPS